MTKFSIITICLNCAGTIRRTIESILSQDYTDYEYIVVDGKSDDGTYETICGYTEAFKAKGITFKTSFEPDKGIYNAMNKGAALAEGEFVNYMNGGDCFAAEDVLSKLNDYARDCDVVYGNTICRGELFDYIREVNPLQQLANNMVFGHQAAFVKRECVLKHPFDETLKISGDYKFFLNLYARQKIFKFFDFTVAVFYIGGTSCTNLLQAAKEDAKIQKDFGLRVNTKNTFWGQMKIRFEALMKKLLPKRLVRRLKLRNMKNYNVVRTR